MPLHVAPLPAALTTSTSPSSSPSTSPITKRCSTPAIDSDYEWDDADVAFEKQYEIRCQTKNDVRVNININISQRQWEHHDEIIHLIDIDEDDTLEHELDEEMDDIDVDYESTRKFRLMHDGIYDRHIHRERWSKTFHEPYISREMAHHQLQHGSSHYVYSQKHIAAMRIKHEATTYHHRRTQRQRRQQVQDDVVQSQTRPMPRIVKDDHGVPIMNSPFEKRPRKNREADRLRYKQQMETIIQLQKTWDEEQVEIGVTPPQKPMNSNNVNKIPMATRWDCVLQQRHAKQQARRTAQASRPILPPSHSSAIASHPKRSRPRRTPGKKSQPVTTSRFVPLVPASAVPALAPTTTKKHVPLPSSWHHNTAKQDFTSFRRHFYDYHHDKIHESLKNGPYGVALRCVPIGEQAQEKFMSAYRQHPQIPALTYHGTSIQHMQSICDHGLLMPHEHRKGIANGSAYGVGIYTATQANISVGYCRSISTMFICAVLDKPAQREHVVTPSSFVVLFNSSLVIPLFLLDFVYDLDPKEITPFTTSTSSIPRWSVRFAPSPLEIHLDNPPKPHHREKSILSNWATRVRQAEIGRHHHIRYDAITWE